MVGELVDAHKLGAYVVYNLVEKDRTSTATTNVSRAAIGVEDLIISHFSTLVHEILARVVLHYTYS